MRATNVSPQWKCSRPASAGGYVMLPVGCVVFVKHVGTDGEDDGWAYVQTAEEGVEGWCPFCCLKAEMVDVGVQCDIGDMSVWAEPPSPPKVLPPHYHPLPPPPPPEIPPPTANVAVAVDSDRAVVESVAVQNNVVGTGAGAGAGASEHASSEHASSAVQNNVGGTRKVAEIAVAASAVEVEELAGDSVTPGQEARLEHCIHCSVAVEVCPGANGVTECLKAQGFTRVKKGAGFRCSTCCPFVQTVESLTACCAARHQIYFPEPHPLPPVVVRALPRLDDLIARFWSGGTLVRWHTPGRGGCYPDSPVLQWDGSCQCVRQMARVDFLRGKQKDDQSNVIWDSWARRMQHTCAFTPGARAQWVESMVGVSYAASSCEVHLRSRGCSLEFLPSHKRELAAEMWLLLQEMGLTVSL